MTPSCRCATDDWLARLHEALLARSQASLELSPAVDLIVDALCGFGLSPARVSLSVITHQPGLSGLAWVWKESEGRVTSLERPWGFLDTDEHRKSPVHEVISTGRALFLDQASLPSERRFQLLASFVQAGATSYLALPVPTPRGDVHVLALWTARPGGWSEADVAAVQRVVPLLSLLVEVTEGRRLLGLVGAVAEKREQALVQAQVAAEVRSRFLAVMSHELRTPMHGVLGLGELLARTSLEPAQRAHVDALLGAGRSLLRLLNDVLDLSKLEADRLELERLPVDPVQLAEEVLALLRPAAEERGLQLLLHRDPALPRAVLGDPTRLRQIWFNLVGNAVKFTRLGSVTVSVEVLRAADGAPVWRGAVRDTGAGIPDEAQARLFEPFTQADSSTTRRFGGTGLGLAISRRLVEQMGGTLDLRSKLGQGSTFSFELPLLAPVEPLAVETSPEAPEAPAPAVSRFRVLVVDDNELNRRMTELQLRALDIAAVRTVASGAEALELLATEAQDLVLMDLQMPDMDGLETTRRLRLLPLPARPFVIAATATVFDEDRAACLEVGMDDFMSKPFTLAGLRAALERAARAQAPGR